MENKGREGWNSIITKRLKKFINVDEEFNEEEKIDKWMLLYTFFNNKEFDFENIKLCDDTACYLRDYI